MTCEIWIRSAGFAMEGVGIGLVIAKLAGVRVRLGLPLIPLWLRRLFGGSPRAKTVSISGSATLKFDVRAAATARPGPSASERTHIDALWEAFRVMNEWRNGESKRHREDLQRVSDRLEAARSELARAIEDLGGTVREISRGDWRDGAAVALLIVGLALTTYSSEIARLFN